MRTYLSILIFAMLLLILGGRACLTLNHAAKGVALPGRNTIGEAGKVYFAKRFQHDQGLFQGARHRPYYPSHHGPLLHASVGWLGRCFNASTEQLYYIGRGISLTASVAMTLLLGLFLRQVNINLRWLWAILLVLLANDRIVAHMASYRPDHWIACLSVLACYLIVRFPDRRWSWFVLILLPAIAFTIKPAAAGMTLPIFWGFAVQKQFKRGIVVAAGALGVLIASMVVIQHLSEGAFWRAMSSGLKMEISIGYMLACLKRPEIWLPLCLPLLLGRWVYRSPCRALRVVWIFWFCTFCFAAIASTRAGSNVYYFLTSFTYGTLLGIVWLAQTRPWRHPAVVCVALVFMLLNLSPLKETWQQPDIEVAERMTRRFAAHRKVIAAKVNQEKLICYSDDAALNILLDQPQIIEPLVHATLIQGGGLPLESMLGPVQRQEYDVMVMTGMTWSYLGMMMPPKIFLDTIQQHYQMLPRQNQNEYVIFIPRPRPRK